MTLIFTLIIYYKYDLYVMPYYEPLGAFQHPILEHFLEHWCSKICCCQKAGKSRRWGIFETQFRRLEYWIWKDSEISADDRENSRINEKLREIPGYFKKKLVRSVWELWLPIQSALRSLRWAWESWTNGKIMKDNDIEMEEKINNE